MSYITEPIGLCEEANTIVLLDQTKGQCMLEHGCPPGRKCPLDGCFARISGITDAESLQGIYHHNWKAR